MKPVPKKNIVARDTGLSGYTPFLAAVKNRIRAAQVKATVSANAELIHLYWDIGRGHRPNHNGHFFNLHVGQFKPVHLFG